MYLAPSVKGSAVLGLPDTGTASLNFNEGGLALASVDPSIGAFTYDSSTGVVTMPVSTNANPAKTTLSINQSTGIVRGTFMLTGTSPVNTRKVEYRGVIIRPSAGTTKAKGFFLLPQVPLPGQKNDASPILSGGMQIIQ